jgi:formate dehydrogenase iron-sulfur subunit
MSRAVLVDTTKCTGCRGCQVACKRANGNEAETTAFYGAGGGYLNPPRLSSKTFSLVTFNEVEPSPGQLKWVFARRQCMHCIEPSCVSACIVGALKKDADGATVYDEKKCIGCRYCMLACPFNVPTLEWEKPAALIRKCSFCSESINTESVTEINGKTLDNDGKARMRSAQATPACVLACSTGALLHGQRDELLSIAHSRIRENPKRYVNHVYGENEVGGTGWLYLSAVPFEQIGFRTDLGVRPYPSYTSAVNQAVAPVVLATGATLGGLYWFINRRNQIAQEQAEQAKQAEESK